MATHRKLMTLLNKLGIDNDGRHELIHSWTKGRTGSARFLLPIEVERLCEQLQREYSFKNRAEANTELVKKKKRSIVLSIATRCGIHTPNNWENFNRFMLNSSIFKKPLNQYGIEELDDLTRQFRALENNYNNSSDKTGTKAWHHKHGLPQISNN